ncbi:YMD3 protein, partial [Pseudoatta argentina]
MPAVNIVTNQDTLQINSNIKLLRLNLPVFSGMCSKWTPFAQLFRTITDIYYQSDMNRIRIIVQAHIQAIIDIPSIKKKSHSKLKSLINTTVKHVNALKSLKRPVDKWDDIVIQILGNKLDSKTFCDWEDILDADQLPTIDKFVEFLLKKCNTLESIINKESASTSNNKVNQSSARKLTISCASVTSKCNFCDKNHFINFFQSFLKLPISRRIEEMKKRNLCINCLQSKSYTTAQCTCKTCSLKYSALLHLDKQGSSKNATDVQQQVSSSEIGTSQTTITHNVSSSINNTYLKGGVRALINSCSIIPDTSNSYLEQLITKFFKHNEQLKVEYTSFMQEYYNLCTLETLEIQFHRVCTIGIVQIYTVYIELVADLSSDAFLSALKRAIICGPSNCGKTNVLIICSRVQTVYVYSKSLQQPKYRYLENLFTSIDEIGYFTFSNNSDIVPNEARPNSIFIFDDVACDKQNAPIIKPLRQIVDSPGVHDASHRAGNNAHDNEMLSIIKELREAGLIYSSFNRGHHYILTVIDVLSKYAWALPLKSKGSETADAIVEIIRANGRCSKNLQTDMGKEFYNADVQKILKKRDVNHYSTYSMLKASIVERFNRTLKSYIVIKFAGPAKFKVGDSVRVSKYKTIFEKGYTLNWTTEVSMIVKVQRTNPVTYLLVDYRRKSVAGAFYEHELHRAIHSDVYLVEKVLRKKEDKVYIKWLGFDGLHNS